MNTNDLGLAVKGLIERVMTLESQRDEMQKDLEGITNAVLYLASQLDEIYRVAVEIEAGDQQTGSHDTQGTAVTLAARRH